MNKKQLWDLIQGNQPELLAGKVYEDITKAELEELAKGAGINTSGKGDDVITKGLNLLSAACAAYGILDKYVLSSKVADDVATVVTYGGKKVRFKAGDKVEALDQISITGINPNPKRKPITGAAKK
jgi:hypothetical protein